MFPPKAWRTDHSHARRTRLRLEELEPRIVPYVATGNAWPHPELITISFVPDGTTIAYNQFGQAIGSTLFHDFNAQWGQAYWQKQILLAAQSWADATNINFAVVGDSGVQFGQITGEYQQGDPTIGDIRIAGFKDTYGSYLAQAYQPPPVNNYSLAGDIWLNTNQPFHLGTTFDLFTVTAHEIGHALGLDHSGDSTAIMAAYYPGTRTGLMNDDIAGIQSIYSAGAARSYDAYNTGGVHNNSFANAVSLTIDPALLTSQLTSLDITTVGTTEYFKFVALPGSTNLNLSVQSSGLSLLSPRVWIYNSAQQQIGYKSGANQYGTTVNVTASNLTVGSTYYIKVGGAESTALGTGEYALSLSIGSNAVPSVTLPNTLTANGSPIHGGGTLGDAAGDQYEVTSTRGDDTIDARLPVSAPASVGVLHLEAGHFLDDVSSWVEHHAQPALPGPHATAADHVWLSLAQESHDAGSSWDTDVVPSLFPGKR